MSIVIFSLLLAGSVLIVSDRYLAKQSMVDNFLTVSHIIADRSTAALSFNDQKVAKEVLSALGHESSVRLGCIYDQDKMLFAQYGKGATELCPEEPKDDEFRFWGEKFELYQPIMLENEIIGTVYIRASLGKLNERLVDFILLVLGMISFVGVVAYFLAQKQQAIISKPILDLAVVARKISKDGDYTTRLPLDIKNKIVDKNDEIGTLNRAFNDMLEQIHKREVARDEAQQALSEREQDLVVTLNSIGDAVIVTDTKGNVTRMNPVAEQLTGWMFDDAYKQPLKNIFPIINTTTQEPIENPVKEVVSTGETVYLSNHTTLIAKNGEELQIADSAAPIRNAKNEMLGMILVFNDVTEQYKLREAAAKNKRDLQSIMDNSPAAIYVEDMQDELVFVNKQFNKIFLKQGKNVIGKKLHEIFPDEIANTMQQHHKTVLDTGDVLEIEEVVQQEEGAHFYSSIKFPLYDEEENIYAVCSISTDITDRRNQEEQLRRSQKMDALGKLTGGIAHDYNNLLGIIKGYAELLNEKLGKDSNLIKYSNDIGRAAERGTKLTKKLLAFTRHKSADEKLININTLLKEQQLMLEKTLTARVTLKMELAEYLWPVWLDSGDLEDAIINMSINASHAIEGSGEIVFQTRNQKFSDIDSQLLNINSGDYVMISIEDTGKGMDKSTKEKIFDPFFSTKGELGTGLGLSQVYGFVKRSGGDVKVYSALDEGTRFEMYFPRSFRSEVVSERTLKTEKNKLQGEETVLVVDDELALVELATDILTARGYKVLNAINGEQALEVLKNNKVDVLFTDVIMPNMDGYQLAEKVKNKYPKIKIQLASGFVGEHEKQIVDSALQDKLLYKPYTSNALLENIRSLLDNIDYNSVKEPAVAYQNINNEGWKNENWENENWENEKSKREMKPDVTEIKKDQHVKTILIMDDEIAVQDLYAMSLGGLGYNTITTSNSDETISKYKQLLDEGNPVDALILDLNIPGSLGGKDVAKKIRALKSEAKIIVCSGDTGSSEMLKYKENGFDGALEKIFDRSKIKKLFEELFSE